MKISKKSVILEIILVLNPQLNTKSLNGRRQQQKGVVIDPLPNKISNDRSKVKYIWFDSALWFLFNILGKPTRQQLDKLNGHVFLGKIQQHK